MAKNKSKNKSKDESKLIIKFNRKKEMHTLESKGLTGKELLLSYQSLKRYIEEKIGMSVDLALKLAIVNQKEENEKNK